VFLDGFDGDTTVSYGFDRLIDLARTMQWKTLYNEAESLSRGMLPGYSPQRIIKEFVLKTIAPNWAYSAKRILTGQWKAAGANRSLVHPDLVRRLDLKNRAQRFAAAAHGPWTQTARQKHAEMFRVPLYSKTLEIADKASSAFGLEARYPFFDRRLMEFCLAIPADQKLGNGWSRLILRRAMEGILPPAIQWRPNKGNLSPNFFRRFLDHERDTLDRLIFQDFKPLRRYVDLSAMREAYRAYGASPLTNQQFSLQIFAAANLGLWLRSAGFSG
jgi:asparagine synthase (glutamine-hydrolysing)